MRRRAMGSSAENWALRQSRVFNPARFQVAQAVENGVEVLMHQAEKSAAEEETKTRKGSQRCWLKELFSAGVLELVVRVR